MIEQDIRHEPFIVALYSGKSKPPIELYLCKLINELLSLQTNGVQYEGVHVPIAVRSFCCDTPARAFFKCVQPHNAYSGCDMCTTRGEWEGRVIFPSTDCAVRTYQEFINMTDVRHHKCVSPLAKLGIGMVSCFPSDYMHLVCLGVMRKLLTTWKDGTRSFGKLRNTDICSLSATMENISSYWPSEFNRKPRSLVNLDRWKATEFRQFLLYIGPVYLKNILPRYMYDHFLFFSVAISLLVSTDNKKRQWVL